MAAERTVTCKNSSLPSRWRPLRCSWPPAHPFTRRRTFSLASHHVDRSIPAGRLDRRRRAHHRRQDGSVPRPAGDRRECRRRRRLDRRRAALARHARRLHHRHRPVDTHVGSIIYNLNYDLQTDFEADRVDFAQSAASGRHEDIAGGRPQGACCLDESPSWRRQIRSNQNAAAQVSGLLLQKTHRHQSAVHSLSRRRPRYDRSDFRPGRPSGRAGRRDAAADPRRRHQGDREHVAATLRRDPGHPDLRRSRRARALHVGMVRSVRAQSDAAGHHRQAQRRVGGGARGSESSACGSPNSGSISLRARNRPRGGSPRSTKPKSKSVADHQSRRYPRE